MILSVPTVTLVFLQELDFSGVFFAPRFTSVEVAELIVISYHVDRRDRDSKLELYVKCMRLLLKAEVAAVVIAL